MNIPLPTLGGKQLWTDLRIDTDGWRIQRHAFTGHCRLLDDHDRRRAWGSRAVCEEGWRRLHPSASGERKGHELVVLLHGLGRSRTAMRPMGAFLRDSGYDVVEFGYASTRATVEQHARALSSVLDYLKGYDRVHFIGHSLGNLVVRRYLAMQDGEQEPQAHVGHVVMLAPPNHGSRLAMRLQRNPVYLVALGPTGQEIADWRELEATLATPEHFGVIAGSYGGLANPLLDAEGDLVVTVEETKLEGMSDFRSMNVTHTFLMRNPQVMRMTLCFLREGSFGE